VGKKQAITENYGRGAGSMAQAPESPIVEIFRNWPSRNAPEIALESVRIVHPHDDAQIGLGKKFSPDGPVSHMGSVTFRELKEFLPGLRSWILEDSYMTVNAYWNPGTKPTKETGLRHLLRKERFLRYLTACFVDLDVGRPESEQAAQRLTWYEAMAGALIFMGRGVIPWASIFARSGRGVYLLWLLRDETDPDRLPGAWPEKRALYKDINRAITQRLSPLGADSGAISGAQFLRLPGSRHTKAKQDVQYFVSYDGALRVKRYTLSEMAGAVGLNFLDESLPDNTRELVITPPWFRRPRKPGTAHNRIKGFHSRAARRAQDLVVIEQHMGGIGHGFRRRTLTMYAEFLRDTHQETPQTILDALRKMAGNCRPPYPSDPSDPPLETIVEDTLRSDKRRLWGNKRLCKYFGITPDLARKLELKSILPQEVIEERKATPSRRDALREKRQKLIFDMVKSRGAIPRGGCMELSRLLLSGYDIKTNPETVRKDLIEMGLGYLISRGRPQDSGRLLPFQTAETTPEN